jgi:hypothetical protein
MKPVFFSLLLLCAVAGNSQPPQPALPPLDKSPMDMSYYPVNYPILKIQHKAQDPLIARVIYGRPQKNNRIIFGDLVPYHSVWRLGANEATEIEFFRDVKINNKKVPKGEYTLYAIPDTSQWTLILNKETDTWGAFDYDAKKDLLRVNVPVKKLTDPVNVLTICFEGGDKNDTELCMTWDNQQALLPISW